MLFLSIACCLIIIAPFQWFTVMGAKTFKRAPAREAGATLGALAFLSGTIVMLWTGLFHILPPQRALPGALFAFLSLALYEWTRGTVVERQFYLGLSEEVPDRVCESGPYGYLRHPFYMSYLLAFIGMAIATQTALAAIVLVCNVALFGYMAFDDERTLARSPLAEPYRAYKGRTGTLLLLPFRRRAQ
jgi:protein-S-isoprenylcysteine O-methyltransferase Ste14